MSDRFETFRITCDDQRSLAASWYPAAAGGHALPPASGGTVIVNSATGVRRDYYDGFARFLAGRGFNVVLWDARGIGDSRDGPAAKDPARMRDWGQLDLDAVLRHVGQTFEPDPSRITVIGHSSGGHLAALAPGLAQVPRLVLIASGTCYWRRYRLREQPLMLAMWLVLAPLMLSTLGYWPGRLGVGHDLPPGVARDWRRWSLLPEYLFDDPGIDASGYGAYRGRVLSYSFTDDRGFAPAAAATHLLSRMGAALVERRTFTPADAGVRRIGHFGFFREPTGSLWPGLADWIDAATAARQRIDGGSTLT